MRVDSGLRSTSFDRKTFKWVEALVVALDMGMSRRRVLGGAAKDYICREGLEDGLIIGERQRGGGTLFGGAATGSRRSKP